MKRIRILVSAALFALCATRIQPVVAVPEYGCPAVPTWDAVPCSMHDTLRPSDATRHTVTQERRRGGTRIYRVTAGADETSLHVYPHFNRPDWVARRVAEAWSAQPPVFRRHVRPLIIGIDRAGPVYWDYRDGTEAAHIIEFPASYVHESANTLDWAFEELLAHEMCHALDAIHGLRYHEGFATAAAEDGAYVSDYARSSVGEDFAESCAAYLLMRTSSRVSVRIRRHLNSTMPHRMEWLSDFIGSIDAPREPRSWHLPFLPAANGGVLHGFVRLHNLSDETAQIEIFGYDESGQRSGPVTTTLAPGMARAYNPYHLEGKQDHTTLIGALEDGQGHWRLLVRSPTNIEVRAYTRTQSAGFASPMHLRAAHIADSAPRAYHVPFLNPASNLGSRGLIRISNPSTRANTVTLRAWDDLGTEAEDEVSIRIEPRATIMVSAQELEAGNSSKFTGRFSDGTGKWRIRVESQDSRTLFVMGLVATTNGAVHNVSR